jgi:hypothetical protein
MSSYNFFGGVKSSTSAYRDWAQESIYDSSQGFNWFIEPLYHIRWLPEFSGLDVVYVRLYYGGGKMIAGLFSGPGGPYLI